MAERIVPPTLAPSISTKELVASATDFLVSIGTFFEMARKEIAEHNNTDWDAIEFLVKGASAATIRFGEVIYNADEALGKTKTNDTTQEKIIGPKAVKLDMLDAGNELMVKVCEVDALVMGATALIKKDENDASENIVSSVYILGTASDQLKALWRLMDDRFAEVPKARAAA